MKNLYQEIYSALAHGLSDTNATTSDIKIATSDVIQSVVRFVHEELVQLEKSEAHTGGEIPVSDLFENNHISHF